MQPPLRREPAAHGALKGLCALAEQRVLVSPSRLPRAPLLALERLVAEPGLQGLKGYTPCDSEGERWLGRWGVSFPPQQHSCLSALVYTHG